MSLLDRLADKRRAWLEERVIERDGCLVWTLAANNGTDPRTHANGTTVAVRRLIYNETHDKPMRRNECAMVQPECCECCVHPDHIRKVARKDVQKGRKHNMDHAIAIAKARRAQAKLTQEQVREIRASTETYPVLARRYGIDQSYVGYIKAQRAWKDYSNPFAGLLAANDTTRRAA